MTCLPAGMPICQNLRPFFRLEHCRLPPSSSTADDMDLTRVTISNVRSPCLAIRRFILRQEPQECASLWSAASVRRLVLRSLGEAGRRTTPLSFAGPLCLRQLQVRRRRISPTISRSCGEVLNLSKGEVLSLPKGEVLSLSKGEVHPCPMRLVGFVKPPPLPSKSVFACGFAVSRAAWPPDRPCRLLAARER